MKISVTHQTVYRYDTQVWLEPHTLRLRPRADGAQQLLTYDLVLDPKPAGMTTALEQEGNVVAEAWFQSFAHKLVIVNRFEAETFRRNPFDFVVTDPDVLSVPVRTRLRQSSLLAPYRDQSVPAAVSAMALDIAAQAGGNTLNYLSTLCRRLFDDYVQVTRPEGPPFPSEVTLDKRAGSCRDLAVLFCDACRAVGLPARFVSGYEVEAAEHHEPTMHAWSEVYLPGGGWRGYDPSRGLAVSESHVALAAALNPADAAPVSGSFRGNARSEIEFSVQMKVDRQAEPQYGT